MYNIHTLALGDTLREEALAIEVISTLLILLASSTTLIPSLLGEAVGVDVSDAVGEFVEDVYLVVASSRQRTYDIVVELCRIALCRESLVCTQSRVAAQQIE